MPETANRANWGPNKARAAQLTHLFGAHLSIAGGFQNAFRAALQVGCDCLQIFVKNQRQWRAKPLTTDQIGGFQAARDETGLCTVVAHASYLVNLASPVEPARQRSIAAMVDELDRCEALGVTLLVVHPGAALEGGEEKAVRQISRSLNDIHCQRPKQQTMILLETTAGQGSSIGHRFDQLAEILALVTQPDRIGVCLDTCHLFAAGYDFRKGEGYSKMIDELDRLVGLSGVKCIHLNDSKRECSSRVDRHEHIGKGKIGQAGFTHFVNDPNWFGIPMILETPKGTDGRGTDMDRVNLKRLRSLLQT